MIDIILTIFWGLVLLMIIVFVHELGHYLSARAFGLRVKEFMIGLPGPKIAFKRKGTLYGITAVPLGGYCSIAGMENSEEGDLPAKALAFITYFGEVCEDEADRAGKEMGFDLLEGLYILADWGTVRRYKQHGLQHFVIAEATVEGKQYEEGEYRRIADTPAFIASEKKLTYGSLPWWKRIVVLLAGSASNLIVAFVILVAILMISGVQIATTTVDTVVEDSPAQEAGLVAGDELVSVNGEQFDDWQGFVSSVQDCKPGETIELGYRHDGKVLSAEIELADNEGTPMVGVTSLIERGNISFFDAAAASGQLIGSVFQAILQLFNPATFADTIDQTSSVVGISIEARSAADSGPLNFVLLIAALSISIGFMNLLPIPPLDGGKIVVETIERVTRKRIPMRVINGISLAGFAILLMLFVVATNADIQRYFLGG